MGENETEGTQSEVEPTELTRSAEPSITDKEAAAANEEATPASDDSPQEGGLPPEGGEAS